jgi:glycine dehydrogenase subunit 2
MSDERFIGTSRKVTTHVNQNEGLIFEKSSSGKKSYRLAELDVPVVGSFSESGDGHDEVDF